MNTQMWDLLKTVLVALISSGGFTVIITKYFEKHSKIAVVESEMKEIKTVINRQGDAIQALLHSNMELLFILHEKNVINGESQQLRDRFAEYMYNSQAKSLKLK